MLAANMAVLLRPPSQGCRGDRRRLTWRPLMTVDVSLWPEGQTERLRLRFDAVWPGERVRHGPVADAAFQCCGLILLLPERAM